MGLLSGVSSGQLIELQNAIIQRAAGCATLVQAAQAYMDVLYDALDESVVLARLFAAIGYAELPEPNQRFVDQLADSAGIRALIQDQTLVLTLLGSRGVESDWNDRRLSRGHVGIPLASSAFIDRIPMMSRLLKELGAGIDWIDDNDTELVARTFQALSGVFFVRDASAAVDSAGRKIIAAQDFVEQYGVKSVFGIGGCYIGTSLFFTTIVFARESLDRDRVDRFMLQANKFKMATMRMVMEGHIF